MAVCKFFLQGHCRYGNSCWNEHPSGGNQGYSLTAQRQLFGGGNRGGGGGGGKPSLSFGNNQGNPYKWLSQDAQQQQQSRSGGAQAQSAQQMSPADIVKGLGNEVTVTLEGGKMWPFTCMGFEKDLPSIPGFDDMSPEEMRLEAYDALKQGNIQVYVQKVETLFNQINAARQELKNPNLTLKQKLVSFIDDARRQKSSSSSTGSTGFNSLFNDPSPAFSSSSSTGTGTSLFGQSQPQSQQNTAFGSSTFGQTQPQSQGLFGKAAENPATFGQSTGQSSLFGSSTPSLFGQSAPQPSFGNQSSVLQQSSFAGNTTTQQTPKVSLFNTGAFSSPGSQTPTQTGFAASASSNQTFGTGAAGNQAFSAAPVFGQNTTVGQSGFGSKPSGTAFGTQATHSAPTAFGAAQPAGGQSGISQADTGSVHTPKEKLSAAQLEQFQAPTFKLGLIPTKPPPRELCF